MDITMENDKLILRFPYHPETVAKVKELPGRQWVPEKRQWEVPDCQQARAFIRHYLGIPIAPIRFAAPKFDGPMMYPPALRQPYPHQIEMSRAIVGAINEPAELGLFAETGTGKTQGMLDALRQFDRLCAVGVVPTPLLGNWTDEARNLGLEPTVVYGSAEQRRQKIRNLPYESNTLALTTYGCMVKDIEAWNEAEMVPDIIFFDESQLLKNASSRRSKTAKKFMGRSKIIMTGTPYGNSLMDIHGQFMSVDQRVFGPKRSFQSAFCIFGGWEDKEIVGWKNTELFFQILKRHSVVFRKEDCLSLPPKMYQTITLPMNPDQKKAYRRAQNGAVGDQPVTNVLTQIMKMRQISSGFVYTEDDTVLFGTPKVEYLNSIAWDTPTIIWFNYKREREDICNTLQDLGVTYAVADGSHDAYDAVQHFEASRVKVLVAQFQSVQYGHTANQAGRVIFYSPAQSQLQRSQSEDRSHRIGQTKSVIYISLVSSDVERWSMESLTSDIDTKDYIMKKLKEVS